MDDAAKDLGRALDQAADALRRADFPAAARAAAAATAAEARLHRRPAAETALAPVRARARHLQTLVSAARQGLRDGADRLAALDGATPPVRTYDSHGAVTDLAATAARLERRA